MDKSAIDTPSREIDLGNIPVHLRTALRRALEFEARAPAPRSAEEAEQCEEQLRAIADEFFGALLTPVLQRAVRSAAVGDAASALVRHLPRRMRSDGLETVNVRTSRGTTVPVTTPYYREKHARRAKRRPGLYPALVGAHSRFPGAVCRQRWTVRLGEVEPVFGQTGRVVLDITARTAHDGALKWTRAPSTPRAARSIFATFPSTCALPSGGRWSLRRVLQRPGRQRKRSSAKSSCGPSRTSSSAPSSPPCCNARWAPPRLATRRAPSCATCPGGCGATAWRPSTFAPPGARRCRSRRRTTARNTPVGRSGGRDSTPPWWCWASTTGARRSWPRMQAARSPCSARWPKRRRSSAPRASPWISRPSARPPIATLRGARAAQQSAACGLLDRVTGKRVVVSLDGGRVRVRRKKRGPKTKKGRNRFHTDWKEPKLLILYVVGDDGRPSQTWAPIIDGTLRGPQAVFALLLSYARQIGLNAADKVLFIADGAPWIWQRIPRLIAALGLSPTQVLGLIDFYHAAKQLSDAVKLRRWSATQRTRWLNRTRGLLKRARVDEVITALRELCRGRTAGKIRTHLNYFLKNRHRFAYTTMVGLGLPRGSGAVESAIRRVINLRIKGASIYWLPESVDAILLLRSFYKSGRWNCLQRMAMTPVGVSA